MEQLHFFFRNWNNFLKIKRYYLLFITKLIQVHYYNLTSFYVLPKLMVIGCKHSKLHFNFYGSYIILKY